MAKFLCVGGTPLSTSGAIPNPIEWRVLSDTEFDDFAGLVDAEQIYQKTPSLFRCPVSGHLWILWDGMDSEPVGYAPLTAAADGADME